MLFEGCNCADHQACVGGGVPSDPGALVKSLEYVSWSFWGIYMYAMVLHLYSAACPPVRDALLILDIVSSPYFNAFGRVS